MNKNILKNSIIKLLVKSPILETVTVDQITLHGEAQIRITLAYKEIQTTVVVPDIVDDFIFVLDIMNLTLIYSGFKDNCKLIMNRSVCTMRRNKGQHGLAEDTKIRPYCEIIVSAKITGLGVP